MNPNLYPSELAKAARKAAEWTERRDALITEGVAAGCSLRAIAKHAGVTHQTVANIAAKRQG